MTISEKDIEIIERYLMGELGEKELELFEQRIKTDKEFADEVFFIEDVINASKEEGRNEFKKRLKAVEEDVVNKTEHTVDEKMREKDSGMGKTTSMFLNKWMYYAAAIAAVIVAGLFILVPDRAGKKLYEEYFQPYPNEIIAYTRGQQVPEEFEHFNALEYNSIVQAMRYYEKNNFTEALKLFEANVEQSEKNAGILFYTSICQLETGKEEQAIRNLNYILTLSNPPLKKQAEWYLILAYLKTNQTSKANQLLGKISDIKNHPYAGKAKELLTKLK